MNVEATAIANSKLRRPDAGKRTSSLFSFLSINGAPMSTIITPDSRKS
jgi:hypothetical protein